VAGKCREWIGSVAEKHLETRKNVAWNGKKQRIDVAKNNGKM